MDRLDRFERFYNKSKERKGFRTGNSLTEKPNWEYENRVRTPISEVIVGFQHSDTPTSFRLHEISVDKHQHWEDYRSTPGLVALPHLVIEFNTYVSNLQPIANEVAREYRLRVLQEINDRKEGSEKVEKPSVEEPEYILVKGRKGMMLKQRRPKGKKGCRRKPSLPSNSQEVRVQDEEEEVKSTREQGEEVRLGEAEVEEEEEMQEDKEYERFRSRHLRGSSSALARPLHRLQSESNTPVTSETLQTIIVRFIFTEEVLLQLKKKSKVKSTPRLRIPKKKENSLSTLSAILSV